MGARFSAGDFSESQRLYGVCAVKDGAPAGAYEIHVGTTGYGKIEADADDWRDAHGTKTATC
jgi:hypothetical protein